jgi:hypothetical protein
MKASKVALYLESSVVVSVPGAGRGAGRESQTIVLVLLQLFLLQHLTRNNIYVWTAY